MIPSGRPSVEIATDLVPGVHDALIELRASIGSRAANRVILHVGELLISSYPMTMSDMLVFPQVSGEAVQVKIKLTRAASPLLMQCYESLGHGVRGSTVVNLLNRLYMMSEAQPELIEEAVKKKLQRTDTPHASDLPEAEQLAVPATKNRVEPMMPSTGSNHSYETEEIVLTGVADESGLPGLSPEDDPLSGLSFTF